MFHVTFVLFAYASFAIAAVMGLTYVLLFRELKGRQPGVFYARLPSLAALDQMNGRAIVGGFACLTAGMLIGLVWLLQVNRAVPIDPRVDAMSMADPKILIAVGSWLLYAFQIVRAHHARLERQAHRLAVRGRLRRHPRQPAAGRLSGADEPRLRVMRLLVLGVSHHTAPDRPARAARVRDAGDLAEAVSTLARDPALGEVVLLSTCNRTELYATCHSLEDGHEAMAGFLTTARAVPADDLRAHIYTRSEADAARHLFRVAAGIRLDAGELALALST